MMMNADRPVPEHRHIQDVEGHVEALASDLRYFREVRLEPRIVHLLRRGVLRTEHLLRAATASEVLSRTASPASERPTIEQRIRRAEDLLDHLVNSIAAASVPTGVDVTIQDLRDERANMVPLPASAPSADTAEVRLSAIESGLEGTQAVADALLAALVLTGRTDAAAIRKRYEQVATTGYRNGARIVARAWIDPEFKERLLRTGRAAVRELDVPPGKLGRLGVAENTGDVHNVVVCTLCSCYPHDLLGDPPWWYRTEEYRRRVVEDPRGTLSSMFGLDIEPPRRVRVHDSTSDVRWMVLPARPEGTEDLTEEELAELVTAESLVGTGLPGRPAPVVHGGEQPVMGRQG